MVDHSKKFQAVLHVIMIILALFCLMPVILLISSSITEEELLIKNGYSLLPGKVNLLAYKYLLMDSKAVLRGYGITLFVTVLGTVLNVLITIGLAYPISRKDLPGRNVLAFIIFFTTLFGGGLVPTYIMWTQMFHIKNTIWALILPGLLLSPFNVIMARTYFQSNIPEEVVEAARIDGAGELTTLIKVVMPMAMPIVATIGLLVSLAYWNDWMNGLYYINDDRYFSIQVLLNKMLMDVQYLQSTTVSNAGSSLAASLPSTGLKMAVAVLGALPMLLIYPFFQKFFVKGITIGAVKG